MMLKNTILFRWYVRTPARWTHVILASPYSMLCIYPCRRFEGGGGGVGMQTFHKEFTLKPTTSNRESGSLWPSKATRCSRGPVTLKCTSSHFQAFKMKINPRQIIYFLIFSQIFRHKSIFQFSETDYFFQNEHDLPPR